MPSLKGMIRHRDELKKKVEHQENIAQLASKRLEALVNILKNHILQLNKKEGILCIQLKSGVDTYMFENHLKKIEKRFPDFIKSIQQYKNFKWIVVQDVDLSSFSEAQIIKALRKNNSI